MIFEADKLSYIEVPLVDHGSVGILPGHHPLLAEATAGFTRYRDSEGDKTVEIAEGILLIEGGTVTLFSHERTKAKEEREKNKDPDEFDRLSEEIMKLLYQDNEGYSIGKT